MPDLLLPVFPGFFANRLIGQGGQMSRWWRGYDVEVAIEWHDRRRKSPGPQTPDWAPLASSTHTALPE